MPVVAVVNRKGGSGKSTLATHLAAHFANRGATVMLADIDRQQSTRTWLRQRKAATPRRQRDHRMERRSAELRAAAVECRHGRARHAGRPDRARPCPRRDVRRRDPDASLQLDLRSRVGSGLSRRTAPAAARRLRPLPDRRRRHAPRRPHRSCRHRAGVGSRAAAAADRTVARVGRLCSLHRKGSDAVRCACGRGRGRPRAVETDPAMAAPGAGVAGERSGTDAATKFRQRARPAWRRRRPRWRAGPQRPSSRVRRAL